MNNDQFLADFPTTEQVDRFNRYCEDTYKAQQEQSDYRMQNYFNCVDDYSWGGICDKAAAEHRSTLQHAQSELKEQAENGKPFVREFTVEVLADYHTGEIVSERLVKGRYGYCWIIKDGEQAKFVGTAKKQATYHNKGYKVMQRAYTVEYYFTTRLGKNGLISRGRVLSEVLRDMEQIPEFGCETRLPPVAYWALQSPAVSMK
jgi:hypothetical protein